VEKKSFRILDQRGTCDSKTLRKQWWRLLLNLFVLRLLQAAKRQQGRAAVAAAGECVFYRLVSPMAKTGRSKVVSDAFREARSWKMHF
jgi:hypothetical protein